MAQQQLFQIDETTALCCNPGGRFHGWLFRKHPDGQWISARKLEPIANPFGPIEPPPDWNADRARHSEAAHQNR